MLKSRQEPALKPHKYSQFRFAAVLGMGALVACVLCVQCVRTYFYTDSVLVPEQAQREAERQMGVLAAGARSAGISDPRVLGPVIKHALEAAPDRLLWIRVLDMKSEVLAQGGDPIGVARISPKWWDRLQAHENPLRQVNTLAGKVFVTMLPFRLGRPPLPDSSIHPPAPHRPEAYVIELAIPFKSVASAFDGLRQNLIVGVIASIALLLSLAVIGLRAPHYIRGRYLENEMQLARRVQSDLQPKQQPLSPAVEFGACAVAADQVGGDFYDIFEGESGKIGIVLGDVSGKGVPAALLVSVLQGAIRSSTASQHEQACQRINRMLCERTAGERFATLFWGVFDPATSTMRYVNAGHAAPMLVRGGGSYIERLTEGGPVIGLLPRAMYEAGIVRIEASDTLILYSDGINEAANQNDEEFGEDRITESIRDIVDAPATEVCNRIMKRVSMFASPTTPADDRTLLVVRFRDAKERILESVA